MRKERYEHIFAPWTSETIARWAKIPPANINEESNQSYISRLRLKTQKMVYSV